MSDPPITLQERCRCFPLFSLFIFELYDHRAIKGGRLDELCENIFCASYTHPTHHIFITQNERISLRKKSTVLESPAFLVTEPVEPVSPLEWFRLQPSPSPVTTETSPRRVFRLDSGGLRLAETVPVVDSARPVSPPKQTEVSLVCCIWFRSGFG